MNGAKDRILIAGIGNVFLGDDGFGVEVVRRLDPATLPDRADVADYGIRGLHLAYALLDSPYRALVLVDALPLDDPPGTLAVLEVNPASHAGPTAAAVDGHGMTPVAVLGLLRTLGGCLDRVLVIGTRPASTAEHLGLSPVVAAVVDDAARLVSEVVRDLVDGNRVGVNSTATATRSR